MDSDGWESTHSDLHTIETFVKKAKSSKKKAAFRRLKSDNSLLEKMKLKDSLFDLDPVGKQPTPPLAGPKAGLDKKKDKRSRKSGLDAAGGTKRNRGDPMGEKRSRIKKSKKRKLKKAEKKHKASLSDTDSEAEEAPLAGLALRPGGEGQGVEVATALVSAHVPPERLAAPFPIKLEDMEGKEGISTETSQDGEGSSSEGEMRVMDEDIMVESGEWQRPGLGSAAMLPTFSAEGGVGWARQSCC